MNKENSILSLLKNKNIHPMMLSATAFAPVNIALIKYWGKRDAELNLPLTNSLSIALPTKGSTTTISINTMNSDRYYLNDIAIQENTEFYKRLHQFCDLFRFSQAYHFDIYTTNTIPTAAGLASSASGFAALTLAFDKLFRWNLEKSALSIIARLGSGSACRSMWNGFVEWKKGERNDGLDSFAEPYPVHISLLRTIQIGLVIFSKDKKSISSREAMYNSVHSSPSYQHWPHQVENDLNAIKIALEEQNFTQIGEITERNALAMHATLLDSQPSTNYCNEQTYYYREKIWQLRNKGIPVYFTQDAGPNLKLLFPRSKNKEIRESFSDIDIVDLV